MCCDPPPQDGARLSASIKTRKASVREVAAEIVALNPKARDFFGNTAVERLMQQVKVDQKPGTRVLNLPSPPAAGRSGLSFPLEK